MADREAFSRHLTEPRNRGETPGDAFTGAAGGAACGDLVRVSLAVDGERVVATGFDAAGCGAAIAAGSAAVELADGAPLLEAARIGPGAIAGALGGLAPAKHHAAELAADALHRALGAAARARAELPPTPDRTLVAMSGGVDSAVAALLSARGGRETVAVTLELWADPDNDGERSCCSAQAVRAARALAHRLGLAHLTLDLRDEFRAGVVEPWLAGHAAGETPNPCVRCNGSVRLDAMLDLATRLGAGTLASGHYARIEEGSPPLLRAAADPAKDQTYMLAALAPASLQRMRFPLGDLFKAQVRAIADDAGLEVARKPDSQDLCFLAGTGRAAFLARHGRLRDRPGALVDRRGERLGEHAGHHNFTVGQRRGIGGGASAPLYVLATDPRANTVTVGRRAELETLSVALRDATLHRDGAQIDAVKLRYRAPALPCRLPGAPPAGPHATLILELGEPMLGAAPGQLACLMAGDVVAGHATIARR